VVGEEFLSFLWEAIDQLFPEYISQSFDESQGRLTSLVCLAIVGHWPFDSVLNLIISVVAVVILIIMTSVRFTRNCSILMGEGFSGILYTQLYFYMLLPTPSRGHTPHWIAEFLSFKGGDCSLPWEVSNHHILETVTSTDKLLGRVCSMGKMFKIFESQPYLAGHVT